MKRTFKNFLLRHGGYRFAHSTLLFHEYKNLLNVCQTCINTGQISLPKMMMFEPTRRCNQNCTMCFQRKHPLSDEDELTFSEILSLFDQAPYVRKVTMIGGEIFIRDDMVSLLEALNKKNKDIVLCTNATLLTEHDIDILKQFQKIYTICISLDGPREIHDIIRKTAGSYDMTIRNIQLLAHHFPITVNAVIQNLNIESLPDIVTICAALNVKKIKFELERIYLNGGGGINSMADEDSENASHTTMAPARNYTPARLKHVLSECNGLAHKHGMTVAIDPTYLYDDLEACFYNRFRSKKRFICQSFRTATVAANGDVIQCLMLRKTFGNIREQRLEDIWNSPSARDFRMYLLHHNMTSACENCPFMTPLKEKDEWKISRDVSETEK